MKDTKKIKVDLKDNPYEIIIGSEIISEIPEIISPIIKRKKLYLMCDENVGSIILPQIKEVLDTAGYELYTSLISSGENSKSFNVLEETISELLDHGIERTDTILAIGGGVIGDLAGLVSAIIFRGINFIQIPTTLLAQVDSSVGGKTAINVIQGKNLVGAFHQPKAVISDVNFLSSLPEREIKCGLSEIIKYGILGDKDFFSWLQNNREDLSNLNQECLIFAVNKSCSMKAEIVKKDEHEKGERALLNLGHTFGHAFEKHFSNDNLLLHGEAIAIGMAYASKFSASIGVCSQEDTDSVINLISSYGLPVSLEEIDGKISQTDIMKIMSHDKKRLNGKNTLILIKGIGEAYINEEINDSQLVDFFNQENIH